MRVERQRSVIGLAEGMESTAPAKSHDVTDQITYDAERDANLAAAGWRTLRFRDDDVLTDANGVMTRVIAALRS